MKVGIASFQRQQGGAGFSFWGCQIRWFKHISTARNDPSMRMLVAEFGYEGYGIYWTVLEKIAENLKSDSVPSATMTAKQWANSGKISAKKFQKIIKFCAENEMFSVEIIQKYITISCPKLLKYRDEYKRKQDKISGQNPE